MIYVQRTDIPNIVEAIEFDGKNYKEVMVFWPECFLARRSPEDQNECLYVPGAQSHPHKALPPGGFLRYGDFLVKVPGGKVRIAQSQEFRAQYQRKFVETEREA